MPLPSGFTIHEIFCLLDPLLKWWRGNIFLIRLNFMEKQFFSKPKSSATCKYIKGILEHLSGTSFLKVSRILAPPVSGRQIFKLANPNRPMFFKAPSFSIETARLSCSGSPAPHFFQKLPDFSIETAHLSCSGSRVAHFFSKIARFLHL